MTEKVLVTPREVISSFLDCFQGDSFIPSGSIVQNFHRFVLGSDELLFIDREKAEHDPNFLQLIPYVLVRQGKGPNGEPEKVFRYVRSKKGGESRLHVRHSLGVGGHINPSDGSAGLVAYKNGLWREIEEEISLGDDPFDDFSESVVGLIYNPSDDVGKVHFGILHEIWLPAGQEVIIRDAALNQGCFDTIENIKKEHNLFELWSQSVISGYLEQQ